MAVFVVPAFNMLIYIDESGNFIPEAAPSRVCCETALVIPECIAPALLSEYEALRATWTDDPEIKGSKLSDQQMAAALGLLGHYDVIAEIGSLDVGHNSRAQIDRFQRGQADAILAGLTPRHNANSRGWGHQLREAWLRLPPQLMTQMYVLVLTIEAVIKVAPNYYAQRLPSELGRFDWILDPKDVKPTPFESVWRQAVCPFLQAISMKAPWARVEGFDYSAFDHFMGPMPEYLRPHARHGVPEADFGLDLGRLFRESVSFPDSKDDPGCKRSTNHVLSAV